MEVKKFSTAKHYGTRHAKGNDIRESLSAATALRKLGFPNITSITKIQDRIVDIRVFYNKKHHYVLFAIEDGAVAGLASEASHHRGLDCILRPGSAAEYIPSVNTPDAVSPYGSAKTGYKSERGSW